MPISDRNLDKRSDKIPKNLAFGQKNQLPDRTPISMDKPPEPTKKSRTVKVFPVGGIAGDALDVNRWQH
ncbi:MAG: hypothetical protein WA705_27775 [Candidatus Ozemobacteraceae bacterium]